MFAVGSTAVLCLTTDAQQRTDSCSFSITVEPPVRSSATTFTAFGDSITEGLALAPLLIPNPPGSYPAILQSLLAARYAAQTLVVYDEGIGGRKVVEDLPRLRTALTAEHPDALLLLEGANDLNDFGAAGISGVVAGLQSMIREGRSRAATVFVGTLLPQRPGGAKAFAPALIAPTNDRIRAMAMAESSKGSIPAVLRQVRMDSEGNPAQCLTRVSRSSAIAAVSRPSTRSAAAASP